MNKGLIIFARKPVPGRVKTRLAQDVGDQAAADLYAAMLDDVLENAANLEGIRTMAFWATDGDTNLPLPAAKVESFVQSGMDLGERMAAAFESAFASGMEACCIIGTDSPDLPVEYISKAFDHLDNDEVDAVFGPAEDGGYYLLGLKQWWPGLFQNIPWSTEVVLESSLKRAGELGLRTALLPIWYDLDEMKDLRRLLDSPKASAPRTREAAHKLLQGRTGLEPPITPKNQESTP